MNISSYLILIGLHLLFAAALLASHRSSLRLILHFALHDTLDSLPKNLLKHLKTYKLIP